MIDSLIDKQDNFEIVRDQIAAILAAETASQQALATAGGKDPKQWKLRVYSERSNPFEAFLNPELNNPDYDRSPIINVTYDSSNFNESASNRSNRQKSESVYNIDCYALGVCADVEGGGHIPGDEAAALEMQRAIRLVRNIIMSDSYTYLGMQGTVWGRWPASITPFEPQQGDNSAQQVIAARIALRVDFNEFSPQYTPETLEYLSIAVERQEDGEILVEADFDYT